MDHGEETDKRRKRKKPSLIRRLWRRIKQIDWKNPINRWKLLFISLFACFVVFGALYGVIAFTNSPTFCSSCHEMAPEYTTYKVTAHSQITCVQCHIKPGFFNMITHKMKSLKEVYYHVTGVPEQIVQTEEEAISNVNCLQCHSKSRLVTASGDLIVNHKGHIEQNIPCITCHAGVVHAKVGARKINTEKDLDYWTLSNAKKLTDEQYLRTNMGTCIDCHDEVNKGEKPWTDVAYNVPPNPEETKNEKAKTEGEVATQQEQTQEIILQAIGKQKVDVKLSMECETCHKKIKVPTSHKTVLWNQSHGATAIKELPDCVDCHQDSKWIKEIAKEDIKTLLKTSSKKPKYTPNLTVVKDESRSNQFCSTCHSNRPPGHEESEQWLTKHALTASSSEGAKAQCYVCHDKEKPKPTDIKAPTDVYCQYCHRTGFKSEK